MVPFVRQGPLTKYTVGKEEVTLKEVSHSSNVVCSPEDPRTDAEHYKSSQSCVSVVTVISKNLTKGVVRPTSFQSNSKSPIKCVVQPETQFGNPKS